MTKPSTRSPLRKPTSKAPKRGTVVDPNLLAGKPWIQGAGTTLSTAGGRARATKNGSNPRIYKQATGLSIGVTYKFTGDVYHGTITGTGFFRASTSVEIPDGNLASGDLDFTVTNVTVVASATTMYIGIVGIATANGEYLEITDNLSMVAV